MNLDLQLMPSLKSSSLANKSLLLQALRCENTEKRPPIWVMRQAGRALPAYQEIRKKHSLNALFRTPAFIDTITRLPLTYLGVDAAIIFADILHVALPLGIEVHFPGSGGIRLNPLIQNKEDINKLSKKSVKKTLQFVFEGIGLVKQNLLKPLIGFAGGPFTLATYLTGKKVSTWIDSDPKGFHELLERIAEITIEYLQLQIEAGVDAIQIFDSWANMLSKPEFQEFALPYLIRIRKALRKEIPFIIFCRGTTHFVDDLITLNPSAISFDSETPLWEMRKKVPISIALQGNLDPKFLYQPPELIKKETEKLLCAMQGDPGFIVNLGHGVLPDTPFKHFQCFVNTVTTWQQEALSIK